VASTQHGQFSQPLSGSIVVPNEDPSGHLLPGGKIFGQGLFGQIAGRKSTQSPVSSLTQQEQHPFVSSEEFSGHRGLVGVDGQVILVQSGGSWHLFVFVFTQHGQQGLEGLGLRTEPQAHPNGTGANGQ